MLLVLQRPFLKMHIKWYCSPPAECRCLAFLATASYKYPNAFCVVEAQWRYLKAISRVHPESNIALNFIFKASVEDLLRISGSFKERNLIWIHIAQHSYTESSFKILLNEWLALTNTNLFMFAQKLTRPLCPTFTFQMNSKPFRLHTAQFTSLYCLQRQSHLLGVPMHLPAHEPILQPWVRSLLSCTSYVL